MENSKTIIIQVLLVVLLFSLTAYFLFYNPVKQLTKSIPGMDTAIAHTATVASTEINIGEFFEKIDNEKSKLNGKWERFRGKNFDNLVVFTPTINEKWELKTPKIVWQLETGEGHAAPVIYDGFVYFLDYDEKEKADMLRCISLETGKEQWRRWYKIRIKRNHGISRTIPAVNQKCIVTIGPKCQVMCVERLSGDLLWTLDIEKQFNSEVPFWYTGQCPLIDNNTVVLAVGGTALLVGIDSETGKILWETPNTNNWKMSHASIIPMQLAGKKTYVYVALGGIAGISAEEDEFGKILWETTIWAPSVIAPSPIQLDENTVFFTAGYGAGSLVLKIEKIGNDFIANPIQKFKPSEGASCEQQTPILFKNQLITVQPKDAGSLRNQLCCFNSNDCTKPIWVSGKENRFGLGPYLIINDKILILNDDGTLTIAEILGSYKKIGEAKLFDGQDAWGPMAFADGYLMVRDSKNLFCIDLK